MALDLQIVIDAADPHPLADWWADVLGWEVEPSDEDFIRKMIDQGFVSEDETTTYRGVLVWRSAAAINHPDGRDGGRPRILFEKVPEAKTVKNRVHLDLRPRSADPEQQITELLAKGATLLWRGSEGPATWATLADPEGNEFCVPTA